MVRPKPISICRRRNGTYIHVGEAMAFVRRIEAGDKERHSVHEEVECTCVAFVVEGERFFQLETYGSPQRKLKGKVSQSIQLDRGSAGELVHLLEQTFPGLRDEVQR